MAPISQIYSISFVFCRLHEELSSDFDNLMENNLYDDVRLRNLAMGTFFCLKSEWYKAIILY